MGRDETGRRKTKKNSQIEKFKKNGKFNSKHVRELEKRQSKLPKAPEDQKKDQKK